MGLAGESGCGKSTLGKSLIRMDSRMQHMEGRVELDGDELPIDDSKAMNQYRFKSISIVPQYAMSAHDPDPQGREDDRGAAGVEGSAVLDRQGGAGAATDARRAVARRARDVPDRALGRDEAAHRDGALDAAQPGAPDRGRDHVSARRLDPEGRRRDARRVPRPRLREEHDGDHARPGDPLSGRRHHPRHVRGQAGREGARRGDHRCAAASVHAAAHLLAARGRGDLRGAEAHGDSRASAALARSADGLQVQGRAARSRSRSASRSRPSSKSRPATKSPAGRST